MKNLSTSLLLVVMLGSIASLNGASAAQAVAAPQAAGAAAAAAVDQKEEAALKALLKDAERKYAESKVALKACWDNHRRRLAKETDAVLKKQLLDYLECGLEDGVRECMTLFKERSLFVNDVREEGSGRTALMLAARMAGGYRKIIPLFLGDGADINAVDGKGRSAVIEALGAGLPKNVRLLRANGAGKNPLNAAQVAVVAKVEARAQAGDVQAAAALAEFRKDLGTENIMDTHGNTQLLVAASSTSPQSLEELRSLLVQGASVNAVNKHGMTPLMRAVSALNAQAISPLVIAGANVEYQLPGGITAFKVVQELVDHKVAGAAETLQALEAAIKEKGQLQGATAATSATTVASAQNS